MFDEEYFYQYPGTDICIQDVQRIELEILLELDRICKESNIPYQLFGGTLLGAVRHKGFIPWDDDVDICMKRKDYERFISIASSKLNSKYFLQTCFSDPESIIQFAKIRKNGTVYENAVDNSPTTHTGIWIDIFPLDNIPDNNLLFWIQRMKIKFFYAITTSSVKARVTLCQSKLKKILRLIFYYYLKIVSKESIDRKLDSLFKKYDFCSTKNMSHLTNGTEKWISYGFMRTIENYDDVIELEFCGYKFPCPRNYDEVLKSIYGNYMVLPPKDQQKPDHGVTKVQL